MDTAASSMPYPMNKEQGKKVLDNRQGTAVNRVGMAIKTIVVLLVGLALASARLSEAQQTGKIYRIGFLSGGFPGPTHWTAKLRTELQQIGYVEGKNIVIDARYTENKIDRLPDWLMSLSVSRLTSSLQVE